MPATGDVVIAYSPQNPRHVVCKRVLGLPGDRVAVPRTARDAPRSLVVSKTEASCSPEALSALGNAAFRKLMDVRS